MYFDESTHTRQDLILPVDDLPVHAVPPDTTDSALDHAAPDDIDIVGSPSGDPALDHAKTCHAGAAGTADAAPLRHAVSRDSTVIELRRTTL